MKITEKISMYESTEILSGIRKCWNQELENKVHDFLNGFDILEKDVWLKPLLIIWFYFSNWSEKERKIFISQLYKSHKEKYKEAYKIFCQIDKNEDLLSTIFLIEDKTEEAKQYLNNLKHAHAWWKKRRTGHHKILYPYIREIIYLLQSYKFKYQGIIDFIRELFIEFNFEKSASIKKMVDENVKDNMIDRLNEVIKETYYKPAIKDKKIFESAENQKILEKILLNSDPDAIIKFNRILQEQRTPYLFFFLPVN